MTPTSRVSFRQIAAYFSVGYLLFAVGAPAYGAASTAFTFLLKDRLGLGPTDVALAGLITWIPMYASFAFGFVRDRWSPLGLRDRGYLLVFGVLGALPYLWLSFGRVSYLKLVVAFLAVTVAYRFLGAALGAVQTEVGRRRRITGRLSALIQGLSAAFWGASFLLSGALQGESRSRWLFGALGLVTLSFALLGTTKPKAIYAEGSSGIVAPAHPLRGDRTTRSSPTPVARARNLVVVPVRTVEHAAGLLHDGKPARHPGPLRCLHGHRELRCHPRGVRVRLAVQTRRPPAQSLAVHADRGRAAPTTALRPHTQPGARRRSASVRTCRWAWPVRVLGPAPAFLPEGARRHRRDDGRHDIGPGRPAGGSARGMVVRHRRFQGFVVVITTAGSAAILPILTLVSRGVTEAKDASEAEQGAIDPVASEVGF